MACVPTVPTSNVCPSGADLATASAPIAPPAPPRWSITTVALRASPNICARGRATMSVGPPAGNGTTMRNCLPAKDWAFAGPARASKPALAAAEAIRKNCLRRIDVPPVPVPAEIASGLTAILAIGFPEREPGNGQGDLFLPSRSLYHPRKSGGEVQLGAKTGSAPPGILWLRAAARLGRGRSAPRLQPPLGWRGKMLRLH